jgi:putative SOS response-associated peptidase YedK
MMTWKELVALYRLVGVKDNGRNTAARPNIAPTQDVPFVHRDRDGQSTISDGRWWLVPSWAKETPKAAMFNARAETAAEKPAFRDAFKRGRCLIPADGYYEWTKNEEDGGKDPWYITLPERWPFSFAGLSAHNKHLGITSCTILTADAVEPVSQVHHRMPIILSPDVYDAWLDPATSVEEAQELLTHHLDGEMVFHRVRRNVNSSSYNGVDAIDPLSTAS